MKLVRADFKIYTDWICVIPSIEIRTNDARIVDKNIEISIHWLVFHARWLWVK